MNKLFLILFLMFIPSIAKSDVVGKGLFCEPSETFAQVNNTYPLGIYFKNKKELDYMEIKDNKVFISDNWFKKKHTYTLQPKSIFIKLDGYSKLTVNRETLKGEGVIDIFTYQCSIIYSRNIIVRKLESYIKTQSNKNKL